MDKFNTDLLPLFPLNVVLYPGMFLPLHIFEKRYKALINQCLINEDMFGVVLIADGQQENDTTVKPHLVGTAAKIIQVQKLDKGQMNIWILGAKRFKIINYPPSVEEYLVGEVEYLADPTLDPLLYTQKINPIKQLFDEYIKLIITLNDQDPEGVEYSLAEDPSILSCQVASVLDVALTEKQKLLELDDVESRLKQEQAILEREIEHLRQILSNQSGPKIQPLPWGGEVHLN